ncbi:hypothetical protein [Sphingopyxis flava]|uniref:Single-strand binding protein family protein n=1 Tax=Sphingopyxis flava TaxID=1507287 RepID=A0A1T4ZU01_9SPHN|nr:hypothetical protein SAMN06295937_1001169 [Sphingopyxis flava]
MQNIAEFHIIGRIGKIDAARDVTHLSVATNYNRRDGNEWKSEPYWNRVTLFGKVRSRTDKAATATWCGSPDWSARPAMSPKAQPPTAWT